jgi:putative zinc finger protein
MTHENTIWLCADTENRLSDFLDGALAPADLAAFERHRAGCADCAALAEHVGATVGALHGMASLAEPPELVRAILDRTSGAREAIPQAAAIPAAEPEDSNGSWFDWLSALAQPQFAYGAAAVMVSALVVSHALGIQLRRPTAADLEPASIYRAANSRGHVLAARGTKFVSDLRIVYEIQSAIESEPQGEPAPRAKPAPVPTPGQTRIAPPAGPHDPTRASRPPIFTRRAITEAASLMLGIRGRNPL